MAPAPGPAPAVPVNIDGSNVQLQPVPGPAAAPAQQLNVANNAAPAAGIVGSVAGGQAFDQSNGVSGAIAKALDQVVPASGQGGTAGNPSAPANNAGNAAALPQGPNAAALGSNAPAPAPDQGPEANPQVANSGAAGAALANVPVVGLSGTANSNGQPAFLVGSEKLVAGGPAITVSGVPVSLAPQASNIVIGGSTQALPPSNPSANPADAQPAFLLGSQSLVAGGAPITVDGKAVSLAPEASNIVVDGSTQPIPSGLLQATPTLPPVTTPMVIGGSQQGGASVDGTTILSGGSSAVVEGHTVAASIVQASGGAYAIIDSTSLALPGSAPLPLSSSPGPVTSPIILGAGSTLLPGGSSAVVLGNTVAATVTQSANGTSAIINGTTVALLGSHTDATSSTAIPAIDSTTAAGVVSSSDAASSSASSSRSQTAYRFDPSTPTRTAGAPGSTSNSGATRGISGGVMCGVAGMWLLLM